ncbi:MAG TPA: glycosyltransferase family 39 protein [Thermoanaerobaculia bacterium]
MRAAALAEAPGRPRDALLVAALTALLLVPFAGKAFHVDDTLFLKAAGQIRAHPLDFYGFSVNWYGTEQPMWQVTKNPPLASYFIALVTEVAGENEIALHLAFLVPAIAVIVGTYALAGRLCAHRLLAALATLLCPAFLVSSTNVMCDTLNVAFWVWAVELWLRGIEGGRFGTLAASTLLVSLAALSKYFGMALVPLLLAHGVARTRRLGAWALPLLIPVLVLAGYQVWTGALYGQGLLSNAAAYAGVIRFRSGVLLFTKAVVGMSFAGGCLASIAFFAPWLWSGRALAFAGIALVLTAAGLALAGRLGTLSLTDGRGVRWAPVAQLGVLAVAGVGVLALALADLSRRRDPGAILLFLWVAGTFVFALFFNWTVNARSLLPIAPAAGILIARRVEARPGLLRAGPFFAALPLAAAGVLTILLALADWRLAGSARDGARRLRREAPDRATLWFEGHWGFQHYMEAGAARALDWRRSHLSAGDRVAIPINNANVVALPADAVVHRAAFDLAVLPFLATLNPRLGAGFYLDDWGPLPFAFGRVPPERYVLLELVRDVPPGELRP